MSFEQLSALYLSPSADPYDTDFLSDTAFLLSHNTATDALTSALLDTFISSDTDLYEGGGGQSATDHPVEEDDGSANLCSCDV